MSKFKWKLHEVIFVAMLCIVFGVVYLAGVYLASFLSTVPVSYTHLIGMGKALIV